MRGLAADIQVPAHGSLHQVPRERALSRTVAWCTVLTCNGRGEVLYQQSFLTIRKTCPTCAGRGQVIRQSCAQCKGEGYHRREKKLRVNIPAGVDTGTRLRLQSEGNPGPPGGQPGDLYVVSRLPSTRSSNAAITTCTARCR